MVAMVVIDDDKFAAEDESSFNMLTRITTNNIQIETGVMILMISSPSELRMLVSLGFRSIWIPQSDQFLGFLWCSWD